jgi:shikimate kinase
LLEIFNSLENLKQKTTFVYIDTDIEICIERLNKLREDDPKYRDYIFADTFESMTKIKKKFDDVFKYLIDQNYKLQYIHNGKEE